MDDDVAAALAAINERLDVIDAAIMALSERADRQAKAPPSRPKR